MDIQRTFSNTFPQQKRQHRRARRSRSTPSLPCIPPTTAHFLVQPAVDRISPRQDTNLVDRIHNLPQELIDIIEGDFLETTFCPGYFLPQIHNQARHTWNKETRPIARPDMLRLNKKIYRKYLHRMWTENTCVVKTASGKHVEMIPVQGHREDPYGYLIERSKQQSPSLAAQLAFQQSRENGTFLHEDNGNNTSMELDHFCAGLVKRLLERLSVTSMMMKIPLLFTDQYDAAGAWVGIELPEDITMLPVWRDIHLQENARILWKAFTFMAGRRRECHREVVPLMAKSYNLVEPALMVVENQIYVFS